MVTLSLWYMQLSGMFTLCSIASGRLTVTVQEQFSVRKPRSLVIIKLEYAIPISLFIYCLWLFLRWLLKVSFFFLNVPDHTFISPKIMIIHILIWIDPVIYLDIIVKRFQEVIPSLCEKFTKCVGREMFRLSLIPFGVNYKRCKCTLT